NMVSSGDWLVPHYDGAVRLNKPPLAYWTGALVSTLLGQASLLALRLPALAAGVGLLLVTYAWGRRVGGARLGLAAAACLAAMELASTYGRRGVADMQLALFTNLALLCFAGLLERPGPALRAGFAVALGLALLAKATAGLLIVGLPIALTLAIHHRWREALRLRNLTWVALAVGIGLAWYVAILGFMPGSGPILERLMLLPLGVDGPDGAPSATHFHPPWFHLGSLLLGASPALVVMLPWAAARAWSSRAWREQPRHRFVLIVFASLFLAFSLLPQKQKHYMLPLLPALAILLADGALARARRDPPSFARTVRRLGHAAAIVPAVVLGWAAVDRFQLGDGWPTALRLAALGAALTALLIVVARRGRPAHVAGACVAATLVLAAVYGSVLEPHLRPPRLAVPTAAEILDPSAETAR
ncbi:MAG TPA: glycosyltransferase family 39 protein, partial [Candidatus Limnocylindrales bacterium]|nr:glycosyltransferase family 39 protein [Candidatus Limnocylindrales bacterium]